MASEPGLPEAIASAAYSGGFRAGVAWLLDHSRAVGDGDKLFWLQMTRGVIGEEGAWGAAYALRAWREQFEQTADRARQEIVSHGVNADRLPELLGRAKHPGGELARRIVRTVVAARRAWRMQ